MQDCAQQTTDSVLFVRAKAVEFCGDHFELRDGLTQPAGSVVYADDQLEIVLFSTEEELALAGGPIVLAGDQHGGELNFDKAVAMAHVVGSGKREALNSFETQGVPLAFDFAEPGQLQHVHLADSGKHLGNMVCAGTNLTPLVDHRLQSARKARGRLGYKFLYNRRFAVETRVSLYLGLVRSILVFNLCCWCLPLWQVRRVEQFQTRVLRGIFPQTALALRSSHYLLKS